MRGIFFSLSERSFAGGSGSGEDTGGGENFSFFYSEGGRLSELLCWREGVRSWNSYDRTFLGSGSIEKEERSTFFLGSRVRFGWGGSSTRRFATLSRLGSSFARPTTDGRGRMGGVGVEGMENTQEGMRSMGKQYKTSSFLSLPPAVPLADLDQFNFGGNVFFPLPHVGTYDVSRKGED